VVGEAKHGSNAIHASTIPITCTELYRNSGTMCQNDVEGLHNTDFATDSSAFQSTSIVSAEQSMDQCPAYGLDNPSDNVLDSIDILSQSRSEPDQDNVEPLAWNTLATDTTDHDALSYGFPMPKDAWRTSWPSVNIGLAIKERKPIVLDGEKYWIVEWERSYIHESETFGVHWDLFVDHEAKISKMESKHSEVSKRKPGRPRKSASSRFSKRSTILKSRKPL